MNANSHDINVMKGISIALMILLIVAIFKLPYGYYTLRIITTLGTGFLIFKHIVCTRQMMHLYGD